MVPSNKQSFRTSRRRRIVAVLSKTWRTCPCWSGNTSSTTPLGHWPRWMFSWTISTKSPTAMFLLGRSHFCRSWRVGKYSLSHRFQNTLARYCACLHLLLYGTSSSSFTDEELGLGRNKSNMLGVRGLRSCWSLVRRVSGFQNLLDFNDNR